MIFNTKHLNFQITTMWYNSDNKNKTKNSNKSKPPQIY